MPAGSWNFHYENPDGARGFCGDPLFYGLGALSLQDAECETVEDWGCGYALARPYFSAWCDYKGVDGSNSPEADVVADLRTYRSKCDGVFMRHVLEHDPEWKRILRNAVGSFRKRMVLVLFTPWQDETHELRWEAGYEVPTIGFAKADLLEVITDTGGKVVAELELPTATAYGGEHALVIE